MKLRKRAAKAVQCKEDASEDSGGSPESSSDEDVYEPGQNPRHKAARGAPQGRNKKKPAPSSKNPELLELALQHFDIRSCLDEETMKSLRLTSKKLRGLVEDAGALVGFRFSGRGLKTFNEFLESPNSIQRVEEISIRGKISISQATKFVLRAPPRLKKLELDRNYDGIEAILCGDFPQLTSFILSDSAKGEGCNLLAEATWPLQEQWLMSLQPPKDNLAAILNNYLELTKLELSDIRYDGSLSEQRFENGLQKLEVLEIWGTYCNNYLKHHLFHENLQLPSIHTLVYESSLDCLQHALSIRCSWMKQLRSLTLGNRYSSEMILPLDTFRTLMAILEGGPLESLTVHVVDNLRNSWDFVSLPNLTQLDLNLLFPGRPESIDFFDVFSSPHLPMLKKATMEARSESHWPDHLFRYASVSSNGVERFAQAFPHLKSLSLSWYDGDVTVSPTVLGEIFTHVVPLLEVFTLDCCRLKEDEVCPNMFGSNNDEGSGVKWPELKELTLNLKTKLQLQRWAITDEYPLSVFQQLVAAAHHCPNLRGLTLNTNISEDELEIIENISETIDEAWPFMQRF